MSLSLEQLAAAREAASKCVAYAKESDAFAYGLYWKHKGELETILPPAAIVELIDAYVSLKEKTAAAFSDRDWTEDFAQENGQYVNKCVGCGNQFLGHKRRITCKRCAVDLMRPIMEGAK